MRRRGSAREARRSRVGCCWALMALLFVAGVMNVVWIAAIALFVTAQKLLPLRAA